MLGNSCGSLGPKQQVLCYNACVASVLTYGLPLWYAEDGKGVQKNFKHMARVQNFTTRWITGAFKGSPIGALEILSGIPPLRLRCNLMINGYIARIATLPENHLLCEAWSSTHIPSRLRRFQPKRRPRNMPSDDPLVRLQGRPSIQEQFDEFHPVNQPGCRVVDKYSERFLYFHLDAPRKGSDDFHEWLAKFKGWIGDMERDGEWMIYTDGGFWRDKKRGSYATIVTRGGEEVTRHCDWTLAASSFDAELVALESTLGWVATHLDDINSNRVTLFIDNQSVIQSFLDMKAHSSQMTSLRINLLLLDIMSSKPDLTITISYCPSHVGVKFNEAVDRLASTCDPNGFTPTGMLRQNFLDDYRQRMDGEWKTLSRLSSYKGRSWMFLRRNNKAFTPKTKSKLVKNFFLDMADNDMLTMARITRAITNHAPIGEYYNIRRDRFPNFPTHCPACPLPNTQNRSHVLTACCRYVPVSSSLLSFFRSNDNDDLFIKFIHDNKHVFTFEHLPLDVH